MGSFFCGRTGYLKGCGWFQVACGYSELNLNQYSVVSPCRTICTVCSSPPCPDLNLIQYMVSWLRLMLVARHLVSKNNLIRHSLFDTGDLGGSDF